MSARRILIKIRRCTNPSHAREHPGADIIYQTHLRYPFCELERQPLTGPVFLQDGHPVRIFVVVTIAHNGPVHHQLNVTQKEQKVRSFTNPIATSEQPQTRVNTKPL